MASQILPRLDAKFRIVDEEGRPSIPFLRWWQTLAESGEAVLGPSYVTVTPSPIAGNSRVLQGGDGLSITDTGAGGSIRFDVGAGAGLEVSSSSISMSTTGVTPGTYGTSSQIPVFNVNERGQITSVTTLGVAIDVSDISGIVPPSKGGTGVDNNHTITYNNDLSFNLTGSTSVALPTSGTVATLDGSETLTNKTLTQPKLTVYDNAYWLPNPAPEGSLAFVRNGPNGPEPVFSDGTNWKSVIDGTIHA